MCSSSTAMPCLSVGTSQGAWKTWLRPLFRLSTPEQLLACLAQDAAASGGVLRFFGAIALKTAVNKDKLWNYKRVGLLPEGTLGREYWKHLTEVGFGFPGEPGGIADSVAYHDIRTCSPSTTPRR